jgi:hypothetical protein
VQDGFYTLHPVKDLLLQLKYAASRGFKELPFFRCHALIGADVPLGSLVRRIRLTCLRADSELPQVQNPDHSTGTLSCLRDSYLRDGATSMLIIKQRQSTIRTVGGWATFVLLETGAVRECQEHGWMRIGPIPMLGTEPSRSPARTRRRALRKMRQWPRPRMS